MTNKEFAGFFGWLMEVSPAFESQVKGKNLQHMMPLWHEILSDLTVEQLQMAAKMHFAKSQFAPTPSDLLKNAMQTTKCTAITEGEAWGEVTKAISHFGMYRPKEALESMSEITRKCVKDITWREICESTDKSITRAHFGRYFNQILQQESETKTLPKALQKKIATMIPKKETTQEARQPLEIAQNAQMQQLFEKVADGMQMQAGSEPAIRSPF